MTSSAGAKSRLIRSVRCNARRLGASSPTTSVTNVMTMVTPRKPSTSARLLPRPAWRSPVDGLLGQRDGAEGAGQQRRQRDPELNGREEAIGVRDELDDLLPAAAALGERARLPFAQRNQRQLGRHEQALDEDQRDDDQRR